jgi:hypothetical protein
MKSPNKEKTCFLDTTVHTICLDNCHPILEGNGWSERLGGTCIAKDKLMMFMDGTTTFNVAVSAFYQIQSRLLEEFIGGNSSQVEFINYLLSISDPENGAKVIDRLSDKALYSIFKMEWDNVHELRSTMGKINLEKNYFNLKSNRYWKKVKHQRVVQFMAYLIRNRNESVLASQFLVILPPSIVPKLNELTGLSVEEEQGLYRALGDNIYELPIQSPKIYGHIMNLFADDFELSMILGTMEELVKRQERILDTTQKIFEKYGAQSKELDIQAVFNELDGLEMEFIIEILNQLKEKLVLTDSQKDTLLELLQAKYSKKR